MFSFLEDEIQSCEFILKHHPSLSVKDRNLVEKELSEARSKRGFEALGISFPVPMKIVLNWQTDEWKDGILDSNIKPLFGGN